ncbi:MAG: four helix bundle protein [Chitinophagales bacterium]|nr:four helix bundle protein [Chitinophagales bacterium]
MSNFKKLLVWSKAVSFVIVIYKVLSEFPQSELYGLTSQIKKSAISIPSNIAEGSSNRSVKEFDRFLCIALGSSFELETQLIIAFNLEFINEHTHSALNEKLGEIQKMIVSFQKTLNKTKNL